MAKGTINGSQALSPTALSRTDNGDHGSSPKLRGMDSNPQGAFGPRFWQAFRDTVTHIYDTVSLPDPSEEARFTLSTRTYPTPRAILMRCQGTAFTMTRGPATGRARRRPAADPSPDRRLGGHGLRRTARASSRPGDVAIIDYARPFHSAATDYANLMVHPSARERARGTAGARAARPCLSARERCGAPDRRSDAGILCAGRRSDGERSRGGDRGHRGADDRLRARKAGGR